MHCPKKSLNSPWVQMTSYDEDADGVILHFDRDQPSVRAKILIGADGYFSRIRKQCLNDGPPMFAVSALSPALHPEHNIQHFYKFPMVQHGTDDQIHAVVTSSCYICPIMCLQQWRRQCESFATPILWVYTCASHECMSVT